MNGDFANLELTMLTYMGRCIAQGKTIELERMGLELEDLQLVARLNVDELALLMRTKGGRIIKHVALDRHVLRTVVHDVNNSGAKRRVIKELILAKANYSMLYSYFALSKSEVAILRKIHRVVVKGRPKCAKRMDAPGKALVFAQLLGFMNSFGVAHVNNPLYQCRAILRTAELTQFSVTEIWEATEYSNGGDKFDWCHVSSLLDS